MEENQNLHLLHKGFFKKSFMVVRNLSENMFFVFFMYLLFTSNGFASESVNVLRESISSSSFVESGESQNSSLKRVTPLGNTSFKQEAIALQERSYYAEDTDILAFSLPGGSVSEAKIDSPELVEVQKTPSFSQESDVYNQDLQRKEVHNATGSQAQRINSLRTSENETSIKTLQKLINKEKEEKASVENFIAEKEQKRNKQQAPSVSEDTNHAVAKISTILREKEVPQGKDAKTKEKEPASKPVRLFNTVDLFRKPIEGHAPKWERVVNLEKKKKPLFGTGAKERMPANVYKRWIALRGRIENLSDIEKAKAVNKFFNQWPYKSDMDLWGVEDYWEDPEEFLKKSGDCADYAITKYYALRELGVPAEKMRIVALIDKLRGLGHAILAFYNNDTAYILDNTTPLFLEHTKFSHYDPKYSVNEKYRWGHAKILRKVSK